MHAGRFFEVLGVATKLGLTSFGGPIAHLGYFHNEYVERRRWIDDASYSDLVALCQFLPGPASSQVGISVGIHRAGIAGGVAAWIGFTLPSAVALWLFALALHAFHLAGAPWLHGLMVVAVAVISQAVWNMARRLANRPTTASVALAAAALVLLLPYPLVQIAAIAGGALFGLLFLRSADPTPAPRGELSLSRRTGTAAFVVFLILLVALPLLSPFVASRWFQMIAGFYRTGSLVFGGGHVVLPLLQGVVVPPRWMTDGQFLAGYGAAQAIPGPLFAFSSFLGATIFPGSSGALGALVALLSIYLPAFLLVMAALPFWNALRSRPLVRAALAGVNAAVVGILLAALFNPVWLSAIHAPADFALALLAFGLLVIWKLPPWIVVLVTALGGVAIALL